MKKLWLLFLFILPLLAGFAGFHTGGGSFVQPPPTPVSISFTPASPSISDSFVVGAQVASINIMMSNGGAFAGSIGFSPPVSTGCAQNGNSSGLFARILSPPTLTTARNGAPTDDGTRLATVTATQNGVTICAPITVAIVSQTFSPDGSEIIGGVSSTCPSQCASLITVAGTWTLGSPPSSGNYPIQLNGTNQGNPAAKELHILSGTLYQLTAAGLWYSWTGSGPWTGPVTSPYSPDSLTPVAGGAGGSLVTTAGTWTFGTPAVSGDYPILLNGVHVCSPGCAAVNLYVLNNGILYQQTAANVWFSWTGYGPWTGPVADPRTVPAVASAAGFNTLVINDNFQTAAFANTATWISCDDGSPPPASPLWYRAWNGFNAPDGPCSATSQATDPLGGQLALKIHWEDSYYTGLTNHTNGTDLQTTDKFGNGRPTSPGFYIEIVARTDLVSPAPPGGQFNVWFDLWTLTNNTTTSTYELDGFEMDAGRGSTNGQGAACVHNNANGAGPCAAPGPCPTAAVGGCSFDWMQYHKYAWRQTIGPVGAGQDVFFCSWIDDNLQGCTSIQPNATQLAGMPMTHQLDVQTGFPGAGLGNGSTGKNGWVKSVKIWSCDTNPANACNSSSNNP